MAIVQWFSQRNLHFLGDFPCYFPCLFPPEPGLFRCPGASVAGPKGQGMWQVRWIDLEVGGALFGLFFVVAFLLVEVGNFVTMEKFQIVRTCKYGTSHLQIISNSIH
jgi:hypothetical protein